MLLIVACLTRTELRELVRECRDRSIEPLVEVHTEEEMDIALETPGVALVGVNNRNLHSFKLDMGTTPRLLQRARRQYGTSLRMTAARMPSASTEAPHLRQLARAKEPWQCSTRCTPACISSASMFWV